MSFYAKNIFVALEVYHNSVLLQPAAAKIVVGNELTVRHAAVVGKICGFVAQRRFHAWTERLEEG